LVGNRKKIINPFNKYEMMKLFVKFPGAKNYCFSNGDHISKGCCAIFLTLLLSAQFQQATAQSSGSKVVVPDWALPGSATHKQVPPPPDFHRPTKTLNKSIGMFEGQSDVGGALVPGSSSYDKASRRYLIRSAGYNIWYTRDEFRFLWKKMSGDVSLAADITFPDTAGYFDRKAVLMIRQNLDDDSKAAFAGLHGAGLIHLAWRPEKGQNLQDVQVKRKGAVRLGIEKRGNAIAIFVSHAGEPLQQVGDPIQLNFEGPFYVGIGFNSHIPDKVDSAVLFNVVLENAAGKVQ
jgi:hypothetical protein